MPMASWEIRQGHVLSRLKEMADASVHCVVTSPPDSVLGVAGLRAGAGCLGG